MTLEELSNEFDVIVNSYDNSQSLVFNEYEKSIYLTKAQEYIIKDYIETMKVLKNLIAI